MAREINFICKVLKPLRISFEQDSEEATFKETLMPPIARRMTLGCCIGTLFSSLDITSYRWDAQRPEYPFTWQRDDPRTAYYGIRLMQSLCSFAGFVVFALRCCLGWFPRLDVERTSIAMISFAIVSTTMASPWLVAKLHDMDPKFVWTVWGEDVGSSEFLVAQALSVFMVVICLYVPIRVCRLWILNTLAVLAFAAMVGSCGSAFPHAFTHSMLLHCSLCVVSFLGAFRNEGIAREQWSSQKRDEQQQADLDQQQKATNVLLGTFCDCVVHLGPSPDFQVLEKNPRLAAFLFRTDKNMLQGCNFREVVHVDDYHRFVQNLQGPFEQNVLAETMELHLVDQRKRSIAVSVAWVFFRSFDLNTHYLVGITEDGDLQQSKRGDFRRQHWL